MYLWIWLVTPHATNRDMLLFRKLRGDPKEIQNTKWDPGSHFQKSTLFFAKIQAKKDLNGEPKGI